jgi:hypothetical protein
MRGPSRPAGRGDCGDYTKREKPTQPQVRRAIRGTMAAATVELGSNDPGCFRDDRVASRGLKKECGTGSTQRRLVMRERDCIEPPMMRITKRRYFDCVTRRRRT